VPGFDAIARETWRTARPLLDDDPTIVIVGSQYTGFREAVVSHPEWRSLGWLAIVAGPAPSPSLDRPPAPEGPSRAALVAWWAACLGLLAVAGAGWALRFADGPLAERLALAPAVGVAVLVPVCLVAERLGVRVGGPAGIGIAIGVTFAGAVAAATRGPEHPERAPAS
jgi:hypothetical protein